MTGGRGPTGAYRPEKRRPYDMRHVVRYVVHWAMQMASRRGWGELRIVMQAGHIMFITETGSYRDGSLPTIQDELYRERRRANDVS